MFSQRQDSLTGRVVRIAPGRADRPNDYLAGSAEHRCPFCAGAEADTPPEIERIGDGGGGWFARSVPNRYPVVDGGEGLHEVLVESPRHVQRFLDLTDDEAAAVVTLWGKRLASLRDDGRFDYVLLFKNEGSAAGASLEHVHSQVVALPQAPESVLPVWRRIANASAGVGGMTVAQAGDWIVSSPPAPRSSFETWIHPAEEGHWPDAANAPGLVSVLRRVLRAIDPPAYNLVLQVAPRSVSSAVRDEWWLEIVPRDSAVAGYELATGEWINSTPPEEAAEQLRLRLAANGD